ncbi:MAG: 30S ribosomal protein S27e [Candidatus Micrarchaeota archaeon]|nr:30S ribosomal protein S27e [Candidatus Micrarchaeota archaeon]MCX8154230.1 30S ribosomal protein S27e [Candidatus Micrarchaeota archaeon]
MSKFLKIRCKKSGVEMIIFSHASRNIRCPKDNDLIAQCTGGKINLINAEIIEEYG